MAAREQDLGSAELEVLKALWETGPANVRSVMEWLHVHGRQVAYTTVQTTLNRLVEKGFVRSDRSGTAFVYRAAVSRDRLGQSRLRRLVDQLYDGATGQLVLHLVRSGRLKPEEIEELQKLIDELDEA